MPATCEQDGTDVRICPKCLSQEEQVAPALSHEFAATLAANEEGHFYPCTREGCSAYEEMGEHSFAPSNRCYSCLYRQEVEGAAFTLEKIEGGYRITSYNGSGENVTVPATYRGENVISIGKELFYGCAEIKRVTFASTNSIIEIGEGAFSGCTSLSGIFFGFGSNLREIDSYAFENCEKLSVFTVQSKVNYIGSYAFSGCSSLGNVTFAETSGWYVEGSPINVRWGGTNAINLTRDHVAGAFLRSQRTL
ncbi:MAG: leucine-rich repeat domain-containing protein [Clostridia bacterium]|nr:leucine-rich repeat domain-containing protein [Clostridia bacterium]